MITIRPAGPIDYELCQRLFAELGVDDPIPSEDRWIAEFMPRCEIAERDGVGVGYCVGDILGQTAYVRNVVSDPNARRTGVGLALMKAFADRALAAGASTWELNVKPGNTAAIGLYRSLGMTMQYESHALRFDWSLVDQLPAGEGVSVEELEADDDTAFESALGLPMGLIASRRRPSRIIHGARRGSTPVGVSAFAPSFPGSFPFRAADTDVIRALLEGIRPHADTRAAMNVVIEDDNRSANLLTGLGAEHKLHIHHYQGPLP